MRLILATSSESRRQMMAKAGLVAEAIPARIDEEAVRASLDAEGAKPRDVADTLAEMKARKIAERHPDAIVIGGDQVLVFDGRIHGKPDTPDQARDQLRSMRGQTHQLLSAVVVYEEARPVWRHVAEARMVMRPFSDAWLDGYLQRNWDSVRHSAGAYKLEEEGVRLFTEVKGDWFTVMGLPLLPLLAWLGNRGFIDG
ncbi:Maf family protein [Falsirhodobacter sp. 20TX0035]|uniref:Maf family protein n=1 Tax=Falsirhodobacter sp. 20TX0035 TaxID=3022019 RepID=UPI00232AFFE5|nr:nucleoside triphosphate pyrophosphatase [Falsirhodobacter sp. 20TX0035]MDB6452762.1 Maf family protein [Falsirhodobacter sp. 20TX0035]